MKYLYYIPLLSLLVSCDSYLGPRTCTADFRTTTLSFFYQDGSSADSLTVTITDKTTGVILNVCGYERPERCEWQMGGNSYEIFSDAFTNILTTQGIPIQVKATKEGFAYTGDFIFATDGCHHYKKSGPDKAVLVRSRN